MTDRSLTPSQADNHFFDVNGYLLLRNVLTASELEVMNMAFDEHEHAIQHHSEPAQHGELHHRVQFLIWHAAFVRLLDHPAVLPFLEEWIEPGLRLDHCYPIVSRPGEGGQDLHHGGESYHYFADYQFRQGRIRSGQTAVEWALTDQPAGAGSFACIPGSHKQSIDCGEDVRTWRQSSDSVREVGMNAGDVLIFTEALTHGSPKWIGDHVRRILLFKYSPGCIAWSNEHWPDEFLSTLTEKQKRLLRPPYMHDVYAQRPGFRSSVASADRYPLAEGDA